MASKIFTKYNITTSVTQAHNYTLTITSCIPMLFSRAVSYTLKGEKIHTPIFSDSYKCTHVPDLHAYV